MPPSTGLWVSSGILLGGFLNQIYESNVENGAAKWPQIMAKTWLVCSQMVPPAYALLTIYKHYL